MARNTPLNIDPVEHSRERKAAKSPARTSAPASGYYTYGPDTPAAPASGTVNATTYRAPRYGTARPTSSQKESTSKPGKRVRGAVELAAGGAIALVGVPMLVLPGPGLLAIGGGVALAVGGAKKLLGK